MEYDNEVVTRQNTASERYETLKQDRQHFLDRARECSDCLLYTSPSPRDRTRSRMPSSA